MHELVGDLLESVQSLIRRLPVGGNQLLMTPSCGHLSLGALYEK